MYHKILFFYYIKIDNIITKEVRKLYDNNQIFNFLVVRSMMRLLHQ